jgi:hypothetical protein
MTRRQMLFALVIIMASGVLYTGVRLVAFGMSHGPTPSRTPAATRPAVVGPTVADLARTPIPEVTTAAPAAPAPPTTKAPTQQPDPAPYYRSCAEVRAAGKAPIRRGQPGYRPGLDRDGDGVACDT